MTLQSACGWPTGGQPAHAAHFLHSSSLLSLLSLLPLSLLLFPLSLLLFKLRFLCDLWTVFAHLRGKTKSTVISFNPSNYILAIPPRLVAIFFTRCTYYVNILRMNFFVVVSIWRMLLLVKMFLCC